MNKKALIVSALAGLSAVAHGAGYALYEASARGMAMGNSLVGSTGDASAVYYNPANISEVTNVAVMVGATFINPFCDTEVDNSNCQKMNAGWFTVPHAYAVMPLGHGFTLGLGEYSEYGMGTKYKSRWPLAGDSYETTLMQVTTSPVISYQATEDWSIAGGLRISWIEFENKAAPYAGTMNYLNNLPGGIYGRNNGLRSHIKGDDWSLGYILATQYRVTDRVKVGLTYRSEIRHKLEGDFNLRGRVLGQNAELHSGDVTGKVRLPQSITLGVNWDATDRLRLGSMLCWTQWSKLNHLTIHIPERNSLTGAANLDQRSYFNWHDVIRVGFGAEYDINDWLAVRGSYIYDMDPSSPHHGTTMIPCGDRHIFGTGLGFKLAKNLTLDLGYTIIYMESETRRVNEKGVAPLTSDRERLFETRNGITQLISVTLGYAF